MIKISQIIFDPYAQFVVAQVYCKTRYKYKELLIGESTIFENNMFKVAPKLMNNQVHNLWIKALNHRLIFF